MEEKEKCPGCGKGELVDTETSQGQTRKKYSCGHGNISVALTESVAVSDRVDVATSKKAEELKLNFSTNLDKVLADAMLAVKEKGPTQIFVNYNIGTTNVQLGGGSNIMVTGDIDQSYKKIFELVDKKEGLTQSQKDELKKMVEELKESAHNGHLGKIKEILLRLGQYSWLIEPAKQLVSLILGQAAGLTT